MQDAACRSEAEIPCLPYLFVSTDFCCLASLLPAVVSPLTFGSVHVSRHTTPEISSGQAVRASPFGHDPAHRGYRQCGTGIAPSGT